MMDLLRAYLRYADRNQCSAEVLYLSDSSACIKFDGSKAWNLFQSESGKHVVQRVPPTESKGRRHTSVVSIAVSQFKEQPEIELKLEDVEIKTQTGSQGAGGQNANKVNSAVRARHIPTGISVFINGRDQYQNKRLALEILEARILKKHSDEHDAEVSAAKKSQLGAGNRSGKRRTYNFIDSTVTDHETGKSTRKIKDVMKGQFELLR